MVTLVDFGAAYIIIMAAVLLVCVLDAYSTVKCLTTKREELEDYAEFMIKYTKIIMMIIFGVYFIAQTFDERLTAGTKVIHIAVGVLALADAAAGFIIKHKFRYGKR